MRKQFVRLLVGVNQGEACPVAMPPPSPPAADDASIAVPAMIGCAALGIASLGFGAGAGARAFRTSAAHADLLEKFPKAPTAEAEELARGGAAKAFLAGTALAGLMGVGAVAIARASGICSAAELGEEIKKWLPTEDRLAEVSRPHVVSLSRQLTDRLQGARDGAATSYQRSSLGRRITERAHGSDWRSKKPLQRWETEILSALETADGQVEGGGKTL